MGILDCLVIQIHVATVQLSFVLSYDDRIHCNILLCNRVYSRFIVLFGGAEVDALDSMFILDVKTNKWMRYSTHKET